VGTHAIVMIKGGATGFLFVWIDKMKTIFFILLLAVSITAHACPNISAMEDRNCDGKIKIVIIGDSIVYGWIGASTPSEYHSYPDYVRDVTGVEVVSYGIPGVTAQGLSDAITGRADFNGADYGIIDVGRNGVYAGDSVSATAYDIRRLSAKLKTLVGPDAFVTASFMLKSLRPEVQEFNTALNRKLVAMRSDNFNVLVRFNQLPTSVLSGDNLHPSYEGNVVIGQKLVDTLRGL